MIDYEKYEVEDFLHDDFFIDWALSGLEENDFFWKDWVLKHPERRDIVEKARSIILSIKIVPINEELTENEIDSIVKFSQLHAFKQTGKHNVVSLKFYQAAWFRIAAVFLIFVAVGVIFNNRSFYNLSSNHVKIPVIKIVQYVNNTKESKIIRMSDGSLAILKPNSKLKYPNLFLGAQREVYLEGEAFFEIHKDLHKPFLVRSHNMITKVLGTSFTVKAFSKDSEFKVIVNTGKVFVYQENTNTSVNKINSVTLIPNQQVIYKRLHSEFKKETVTTPLILSKELAKKEFSYTNTPLYIIINKLNKAYGVKIEYDEEKLGNLVLTASLSDRPLDDKVKLICKAINAKCEFIEGRITIHASNDN